ncbi:MAG: hypothetical protein GY820_21370 [Gammaproteobacteria bacterium]|nr:hypothetical protein [Gammaproteobacteria bacterium]
MMHVADKYDLTGVQAVFLRSFQETVGGCEGKRVVAFVSARHENVKREVMIILIYDQVIITVSEDKTVMGVIVTPFCCRTGVNPLMAAVPDSLLVTVAGRLSVRTGGSCEYRSVTGHDKRFFKVKDTAFNRRNDSEKNQKIFEDFLKIIRTGHGTFSEKSVSEFFRLGLMRIAAVFFRILFILKIPPVLRLNGVTPSEDMLTGLPIRSVDNPSHEVVIRADPRRVSGIESGQDSGKRRFPGFFNPLRDTFLSAHSHENQRPQHADRITRVSPPRRGINAPKDRNSRIKVNIIHNNCLFFISFQHFGKIRVIRPGFDICFQMIQIFLMRLRRNCAAAAGNGFRLCMGTGVIYGGIRHFRLPPLFFVITAVFLSYHRTGYCKTLKKDGCIHSQPEKGEKAAKI